MVLRTVCAGFLRWHITSLKEGIIMTYLFCNIGWMEDYRGQNKNDKLRGGGSYVEAQRHGGEVCNFVPYKKQIYGYVRLSNEDRKMRNKININRLGAKKDDSFIENVNVLWTAKDPAPGGKTVIVGWYTNATVYREFQEFDKVPPCQKANNVPGYRIVAEESNCTLLPTGQRTFRIPRGRGGMGQKNIWYADQPRGKKTLQDMLNSYPSLR